MRRSEHSGEGSAELVAAFAYCAGIVRRRARNFYYGLRLTPEPKRSALYAVYAWMRRADDAVDQPGTSAERRERLQRWRDRTERIFTGLRDMPDAASDPVLVAFAATVREFRLDPGELREMLGALMLDLDREPGGVDAPAPMFRTREELASYCHGVASVVGVICARIWGIRNPGQWPTALEAASKRGLAFQLTNILRDAGRDYDEGRVYIAQEDFDAAGVSPKELRAWSRPDRCEVLVRRVGSWAEECFDASAPLDGLIHRDGAAALWTMTRIYRALLRRITARPRSIVEDRRIRLASFTKATIAVRGMLRSRSAAGSPS